MFKEKNPSFVRYLRYEGNLSLVEHPIDPISNGDGSLEVSGSLYTDKIGSATPLTSINVGNPVNVVERTSAPTSNPPSGYATVFASSSSAGKLQTLDSNGNVRDLNTLSKNGDIMTFDETTKSVVNASPMFHGDVITYNVTDFPRVGVNWSRNEKSCYSYDSVGIKTDGYIMYFSAGIPSYVDLGITIPFSVIHRNDSSDVFSSSTILETGKYDVTSSVTISSNSTSSYSVGVGGTTYIVATKGLNTLVSHSTLNVTTVPYYFTVSPSSTGDSNMFVNVDGTRLNIIKTDLPTTDTSIILTTSQSTASTISSSAWTTFATLTATVAASAMMVEADLVFAPSADFSGIVQYRVVDNSSTVLFTNTTSVNGYQKSEHIVFGGIALSSNDVITIQSKIITSSSSSSSITLTVPDFTMTSRSSTLDSFLWRWINVSQSSSSLTLNQNTWTDVNVFDTYSAFDSSYTVRENNMENNTCLDIKSGGTYSFWFSTYITTSTSSSICVKLLVDIGTGYMETHRSYATVITSGRLLFHDVCFLRPNSSIKYQIISSSSGTATETNSFIERIESSSSPTLLRGSGTFGKAVASYIDTSSIYTTATTLSKRSSFSTGYINVVGKYVLMLSYEWIMTDYGTSFEVQIVIDETVVDDYQITPQLVDDFSADTKMYLFDIQTQGYHNITMNVRTLASTQALATRNIRFFVFST